MSALAEVETRAPALSTAAPRVDMYLPIHKALRLFMSDTLTRVGRLDLDDPLEMAATLGQLEGLLEVCRGHLGHENDYIHTAIEARRPGASLRIAGEHEEHLEAIAALESEAAALRTWPGAAAAHRLYRHLALFIAENFAHMNIEETAHNAALWELYSDAELNGIHDRLLASIDPAEMAGVLRWMLPALNPAERAAMLREMRQQMPPPVFQGIIELVRPRLDASAWRKLVRDLGLRA